MHNALPQERYTLLAVLIHWAVAVLVFFQLGLGSYIPPASSGFHCRTGGWKEPFLNKLFSDIHEVSAITLAVLVGVHVLAAVAHAVRPGDHLFRRMLPRSLVP